MFLGEYSHSIDDKGRLTVPARFRQLLAQGGVITRGLDGNLVVMLPEAFATMVRNLEALSITDPKVRDLRRVITGQAERVEPDGSGRILIPQFLREEFKLGAEVKLVGISDQFEIWPQEAWARVRNRIDEAMKADPASFSGVDLAQKS
ncbi:MAG: division/cell wall cluster transcriptional repressor MraZ [Anaerolineales bacterium]|nr:division/cell wall cluster transcriptional repressor MraZ [Anaerolineales bacterium]